MTTDVRPIARPATVSVTEAARLLGIGRSLAYELARWRSELAPVVPVIHVGEGRYRVPARPLAAVLGLDEAELVARLRGGPPMLNSTAPAQALNPWYTPAARMDDDALTEWLVDLRVIEHDAAADDPISASTRKIAALMRQAAERELSLRQRADASKPVPTGSL